MQSTTQRVTALTVSLIVGLLLATLLTTRPAHAAAASPTAMKAEQVALAQRGDPYRYGAEGPGAFDCSGLVQYSYAKAGVKLPRTTTNQWHVGRRIWHKRNLKVGDIVFLSRHHDSIYVGHHNVVVAPHTGSHVKIQDMYAFYGARRVA